MLPGTGGLTRLVDKRHVRRDLADVFATRAEGVQGRQAVEWGLVDSTAARSDFADHVAARARARAAASDRPRRRRDHARRPLRPPAHDRPALRYSTVEVSYQRELGAATILNVRGPAGRQPAGAAEIEAAGGRPGGRSPPAGSSTMPSCTCGSTSRSSAPGSSRPRATRPPMLAVDASLAEHARPLAGPRGPGLLEAHPQTARRVGPQLVALIEPGSCFAGTLAELALAADRSFMLDGPSAQGRASRAAAGALILTDVNDGRYPMANGLSRLATRFWGHPDRLDAVRARSARSCSPPSASNWGWSPSRPTTSTGTTRSG